MKKTCELCDEMRHGSYRWCKDHLKEVKERMKEDGYLQPVPPRTPRKNPYASEHDGGGSFDNAVRATEDGC